VGGKTDKDWVQIWRSSPEAAAVRQELDEVKANSAGKHDDSMPREFATGKYVTYYYYAPHIIIWAVPQLHNIAWRIFIYIYLSASNRFFYIYYFLLCINN
jgi:hypothetical protein